MNSVLVVDETNHVGNAEDDKQSTIYQGPHTPPLLLVCELSQDHDGEDPQDHLIYVADFEEEPEVYLLLRIGQQQQLHYQFDNSRNRPV